MGSGPPREIGTRTSKDVDAGPSPAAAAHRLFRGHEPFLVDDGAAPAAGGGPVEVCHAAHATDRAERCLAFAKVMHERLSPHLVRLDELGGNVNFIRRFV